MFRFEEPAYLYLLLLLPLLAAFYLVFQLQRDGEAIRTFRRSGIVSAIDA